MAYIMEIIEQIYQEMILIEFGNNQEKIFILKFIPSKNIFIMLIE
jgi:hypothetical protein